MTCPKCGHILTPRRAQRQSNLLHKAIADVGSQLGIDPAVLKVEIKLRAGHWIPYPMAELPEWPGRFVADETVMDLTGHPAVFLKSESAYDKTEESRLLAVVKAYAFSNGVSLDYLEE